VRVTWQGLDGDMVADRRYHGGLDKAIHLYPQDHYDWWRARNGDHALLDAPGAFGENIASRGGTEEDICLGDRFSFGSAIVEVSHGRQPCWKLDHRFGERGVMAAIVTSARSGLYFRVLREGEAEAGQAMNLLERPLPDWPIARVFRLLIAGGHKRDPEAVKALANMPVLADAWRDRAYQLVG
jgi:MOSC domain-containing protein YiiM